MEEELFLNSTISLALSGSDKDIFNILHRAYGVVMHRSDRIGLVVLNVRPFFCVQAVLTGSAKMRVRTQNIHQNNIFSDATYLRGLSVEE